MLFSNVLKPVDIADVHMNNIKIDYVESIRFLGVLIDDKLKFNVHINEIAVKISKNIGILYKLRQYVPNSTLLAVYRSIIECYLSYCNLAFGNAANTHISSLVIAQKRAVRIVASQPPFAHTNPIFSYLNILQLSDIYLYNLGIYMKKNVDNFTSNYCNNLHNTLSGNHYAPSFQRLALTQRQSIMYQAPVNWQNIPLSIRNSRSLDSFKRTYKTFLLSRYSDDY